MGRTCHLLEQSIKKPLGDGAFADHMPKHGVLLKRSGAAGFRLLQLCSSRRAVARRVAAKHRQPFAGGVRTRYPRTAWCSFMLPSSAAAARPCQICGSADADSQTQRCHTASNGRRLILLAPATRGPLGGNARRRYRSRLPADGCGDRYGNRTRDCQFQRLVLYPLS